jgi:hypothetical protein
MKFFGSTEFNISHCRACRKAALTLVLAAIGAEAAAQALDGTIDDILDREVEAQVEAQVEASIEGQVEEQVEADVAASVEEQVEADVAASVEEQVEADVAASVEEQIEADVALSVEQQVESSVAQSIELEVESSVSESVELQVESDVAEAVELAIETEVGDSIELGVEVDPDLVESLEEALAGQAETSDGSGDGTAARFAGDVDPSGRSIEGNTWVVLVPAQFAERIESWGFVVRERRELAALDRVMLRVDAPEDRDIVQAALDLALDAPGTVVDYNHVYGASDEDVSALPAPTAAPVEASAFTPRSAGAVIGIVDSGLDTSHPALHGVEIEQRDFVPFANERPQAHGTAVASIILDAAGGPPRFDRLLAASVFFNDGDGKIRAATTGLIAGLDWLAQAPGIGVINMSLAGPPNQLLEVALDALAAEGITVAAAVGNNGPTSEPLYPAAYESVVGVTAVDSANRIYRYANRGRHVTFSAPGVQVRVAAPAGRYSTQSGTSLAAAYVAALIAETMTERAWSSTEALHHLKLTAADLGEPHFDEIFGFGLVHRTR